MEEKRRFVCRNRNPNPGNCRPILDSRYLIIKDEKRAAKKLVRIPTGHQRSSAVESKTQKINEKGVGSSVFVNTTPTNRVIELASYDLLTSLVQRNFDRAVGGTTDGGTEWEIVSEIKNLITLTLVVLSHIPNSH